MDKDSKNRLNSRQFAYWLMGYFEIVNPETISEEQTKLIKEKLDSVFQHVIELETKTDTEVAQIPSEISEDPFTNFGNSNDGGIVRC